MVIPPTSKRVELIQRTWSGVMPAAAQSGLSLLELLWCVLSLAGAFMGGRLGYSHFGVWGAILGVPLGGVAGLVAAFAIALLLAGVLQPLFGGTAPLPRTPEDKGTSKDKT
jgi:hypothetical protein